MSRFGGGSPPPTMSLRSGSSDSQGSWQGETAREHSRPIGRIDRDGVEERTGRDMDAKLLMETRFLTVVDTYTGYCQVCHEPHVVGKIAVAGWEYHGTICGPCLAGLADEVQRRGKGLAVEKAGQNGNAGALAAIVGGNGYGRDPVRR